MKIAVLGCKGYIGYPLTLHLLNKGHVVCGLDNNTRMNRVSSLNSNSLTSIATVTERNDYLTSFENFNDEVAVINMTDYKPLKAFISYHKPDVIVHLAEQPSAPWSMKSVTCAGITQRENVIGTLNLLWIMKDHCPNAHLVKLGCYDDKTEILTNSGWKLFKDLLLTDEVCCLDSKAEEIKYEVPSNIVKYLYIGKMMEIKTSSLDCCITPNHRVVHKRRSNSSYKDIQIDKVDELNKFNSIYIPRGGNWKEPRSPQISDSWLNFLGVWLSDGFVGKSHERVKYVCFKVKSQKKIDFIRMAIGRLGLSWKEYDDNGFKLFRIFHIKLAKYLSHFGRSWERYIPQEIKQCSKEQLEILYNSFMNGDGTPRDRSDRYNSTSKELIDDIQEISLKIGLAASVGLHKGSKHQMWQLTISDKTINRVSKDNRKWIDYNGEVFCCTVSTGIIYVRRNGRVMWSGNTMGEYGCPDCDIPEGVIPRECMKDDPEATWDCPMSGLLFPRSPNSFYHLSKVHDTYNIKFACDTWGLRSTDIMQGVVFGLTETDEVKVTRFDYDEYFGTVINRFCAQAIINHPLTVYGKGNQVRGFLPLKDSIQCLTLIIEQPPYEGEYRTLNQFENIYSINNLANMVHKGATFLGLKPSVHHLPNPRTESDKHYYSPKHQKLFTMGYRPTTDIQGEVTKLIKQLMPYEGRVIKKVIMPETKWKD